MRVPELQDKDKKAKKWLLKRYQRGIPLSRPFIYSKSHLFQVDKQASQQFPGKLFWDKKNARVNSQKVLLANVTKEHWSLCQEIRSVFDFKSNLS